MIGPAQMHAANGYIMDGMVDIGRPDAQRIERQAALRNAGTINPAAPASSASPVRKITVAGKGTQLGVIAMKPPGDRKCAIPATR